VTEHPSRSVASASLSGVVFTVVAAGAIVLSGAIATFGSLVLRARLHLGHWPRPQSGNPFTGTYSPSSIDPKSFGLHCEVAYLFTLAAFYVVPVAAVTLVLSHLVPRTRPPAALTALFLCAAALAAGLIVLDPGGFAHWFAD